MFQSPIGEVLVEATLPPPLTALRLTCEFQSPIGEVLVEARDLTRAQGKKAEFQSPIGEVLVEALGGENVGAHRLYTMRIVRIPALCTPNGFYEKVKAIFDRAARLRNEIKKTHPLHTARDHPRR